MTSCRDMPMPLSDTVIVRPGIVAHPDLHLRVALEQRAVGNRLEAELSQASDAFDTSSGERFPCSRRGVDHQMEKLGDLGLKAERFPGRRGVHKGFYPYRSLGFMVRLVPSDRN